MTQVKSRKCVACNEYHNGKEMLRVVKDKEGTIRLDVTGKLDGRGAYVCKNTECIEKAIKTRGFNRSLHSEIPEEVITDLYQITKEKSIEE